MDLNLISPYVRRAKKSVLTAPFVIRERVILDYELILIASGEVDLFIDGESYRLQKNNVVLIPPGVPHSMCLSAGTLAQPHIHFDAIYETCSKERRISFKPLERLNPRQRELLQEDVLREYGIPYVFEPQEMQRFQKYFYEIIDAWETRRECFDLLCKAKMALLLRLLIKQFGEKEKKSSSDSYCEELKEYIDENFEQILTLDGLERQFGINKYTLLRNFKKVYGENVISYYNEKRIAHAQKLLRDTSLSITEIALQLNFSDIYTFSRFFKQKTGTSPKLYRDGK